MQHQPKAAVEAPGGGGDSGAATDGAQSEQKAVRDLSHGARGERGKLVGSLGTSGSYVPADDPDSTLTHGSCIRRGSNDSDIAEEKHKIVEFQSGAPNPAHRVVEVTSSTPPLASEYDGGEGQKYESPGGSDVTTICHAVDENVQKDVLKGSENAECSGASNAYSLIRRGMSRSMVIPAASRIQPSSPSESDSCTSDSNAVSEGATAAVDNCATEAAMRDCVEYVKSDAEAVEVVSGEEDTGPSRQDDSAATEAENGEQKESRELQVVTPGEVFKAVQLSATEVLVDEVHTRSRRCSVESVEAVGDFAFGDAKPSLRKFSGYLKKKSPSALVGWQTRWFELKDRRLMYYKRQEDQRPLGRLDLDLIKIKVQCLWDPREFHGGLVGGGSFLEAPVRTSFLELICCGGSSRHHQSKGSNSCFDKDVRFRIKPVGSKRVFELEGPYSEVVEWIDCLRESTRTSHLQESSEAALVAQQKWFWKIERVSSYAFADVCCTGDVLLFRTSKLHAKMQRFLTRGTYDHVGMVLRNRRGQIYVLECMGDTGVILTPWKAFVENKWYRVYERVVWRRLYWPVSHGRLDALLGFLKQVIGKEYKLTLAKLLNRKPYESFSERRESELNLTEGCSLSEELKIDFFLPATVKPKRRLRVLKKKTKPKQNADDLQTLVSTLVGPKAAQEMRSASSGITTGENKSALTEGNFGAARKFFSSSDGDKSSRLEDQAELYVGASPDQLNTAQGSESRHSE